MGLRIGFDLDGVLADLDKALLSVAFRLFGPDQVATSTDGARPRYTGTQALLVWSAAVDTENFWETLPETEPGIVARIASESQARGWDVYFLTQRPSTAGDPVEAQTRRWLDGLGFADARVTVTPESRGGSVRELGLDLAVDDRPENCASIVAESTASAVLVWRADRPALPEGTVPQGVSIVSSVGEYLDTLTAC